MTTASYSRKAITFGAVTTNITKNSLEVEFDQATEDWGTITHIYIMDAETGGNALYWKELTTARAIYQDDILKVPVNNLTVEMD